MEPEAIWIPAALIAAVPLAFLVAPAILELVLRRREHASRSTPRA